MRDPRLFNHPVVRIQAGRLARDLHNAMFPGRTCSPPEEYGFLALLSDPSRPETVDYLVRSGAAADGRWGARQDVGNARGYGPDAWFATGPDPQLRWVGVDDTEADALEEAALWRRDHWHALRDSPDALVREWLEVHRD